MNAKLKPCPLCGSQVRFTSDGIITSPLIECAKCNLILYGQDNNNVIETWNIRTAKTCECKLCKESI